MTGAVRVLLHHPEGLESTGLLTGGLLEPRVEMFLRVGLPLAPLLLCGVDPSRAPEFSGADAGAVPWKASRQMQGGFCPRPGGGSFSPRLKQNKQPLLCCQTISLCGPFPSSGRLRGLQSLISCRFPNAALQPGLPLGLSSFSSSFQAVVGNLTWVGLVVGQELCEEMESKQQTYQQVQEKLQHLLATCHPNGASMAEHSLRVLEQKWGGFTSRLQEQKVGGQEGAVEGGPHPVQGPPTVLCPSPRSGSSKAQIWPLSSKPPSRSSFSGSSRPRRPWQPCLLPATSWTPSASRGSSSRSATADRQRRGSPLGGMHALGITWEEKSAHNSLGTGPLGPGQTGQTCNLWLSPLMWGAAKLALKCLSPVFQ